MPRKRAKDESRTAFESESMLCSEFMDFARAAGFKVYPETSEFDILLVATEQSAEKYSTFAPGDQIGIQAKLKGNVEVLHQALPRMFGCFMPGEPDKLGKIGPHYYAVLVPSAIPEFYSVAYRNAILVFAAYERDRFGGVRLNEFGLSSWEGRRRSRNRGAKRFVHQEPCWVPGIEVNIPAGRKGPQQLTPWKMGAVKLCLRAELNGFLTTKDFAAEGISMSRWLQSGWIRPGGFVVVGGKRLKQYLLSDSSDVPHRKNPEIVEAMEAAGLV
jgi:hypothetical protein